MRGFINKIDPGTPQSYPVIHPSFQELPEGLLAQKTMANGTKDGTLLQAEQWPSPLGNMAQ